MQGQTLQIQTGLPAPAYPSIVQIAIPPNTFPGMQFSVQINPIPVQLPPEPPKPAPPPAQPFVMPPQKKYYYRNRRDDDYLLYGYGGLGGYYMMSSYHYNYDLMYYRDPYYHHYAYGYYGYGGYYGGCYDHHYGYGGYYGHHHHHHHHYDDHHHHHDDGAMDVGDEAMVEGEGDFEGDAIGDAYGEDTPIDSGDFEAELNEDAAGDEAGEADEAVDMYGGAGPTDLPDGGRGPGDGVDGVAAGKRADADDHLRVPASSSWCGAARMARRAREAAERRAALAAVGARPYGPWVEKQWREMVASAEESVLGSLAALSYPHKPRLLAPPPASPPAAPITLVTQCSVERLPQLVAQLTSWRGPASVALYIEHEEGSEEAKAVEAHALKLLHELPSNVSHELILSLGYPPESTSGNATGAEALKPLYPINFLRNLALRCARTDLVFLVDVDFVPSAGLLRDLARDEATLDALWRTRTALVIPAFEVAPEHRLPKQQAALSALASCSPPAASPFHVAHFPAGHGPTDFSRWFASSAPYAVAYEDNFEPYVVASRSWLPSYDDRFTGYGMNKVSHLYATAALGARFVVAPRHFVAAHEHTKSSSWQATFGTVADPKHRMRVAALFRQLKLTLPPLPLPLELLEGQKAMREAAKAKASAVVGKANDCGEPREGVKGKRRAVEHAESLNASQGKRARGWACKEGELVECGA